MKFRKVEAAEANSDCNASESSFDTLKSILISEYFVPSSPVSVSFPPTVASLIS